MSDKDPRSIKSSEHIETHVATSAMMFEFEMSVGVSFRSLAIVTVNCPECQFHFLRRSMALFKFILSLTNGGNAYL